MSLPPHASPDATMVITRKAGEAFFTPKRAVAILMTIFILASLAAFVYANNARPRVLVLQSYDLEYNWTRDIDVGLSRVFLNKPLMIRKHYMDTKRQPDRAFAEKQGVVARRIIDEWRPDVLIAVDDDAQRYAAKFYNNHPSMKIVFAGINGEVKPYGYDTSKNATGILERKQLLAVRDAMIEGARSKPGRQLRLAKIGDTSGSVKEDTHFIQEFDWKPAKLVSVDLVKTFDEWKAAVKKANEDADFILTTNYRRIEYSKDNRKLVPPKELVKWTEDNSAIPIIGTNGFYVEDGGMFAVATSPFEQGETAAEMALKIIEKGVEPKTIRIERTREFIVYMRPAAMKKHDFEVSKVYESFARAMNNYFDSAE